jgi:hypothetical protein
MSFPRLGDYLKEPSSYDPIGFISSLLCRRAVLAAIDPEPYRLGSYFGHVGTLFAAFADRPVKIIADPWITQRQNNQRYSKPEEATMMLTVQTGVAILRLFMEIEKRSALTADELWGMSFLHGGAEGQVTNFPSWVVDTFFAGLVRHAFGRFPGGSVVLLRDLLLNEGQALPPRIQQHIYGLLMIAIDSNKLYRQLG